MFHATARFVGACRVMVSCASLAVCAAGITEAVGQNMDARDELATRLTRRELQRAPSSIPGREIVQVVTEIPVGVESGWHVHPGEEVGYIVAGQVVMEVQGRVDVVLHVGDGFLIPPRTPHNARDIGPETGQMLSTYLVEVGSTLSTFVNPPTDRR
jgi:quercetin dioxygenase-like cupin family protein